VAYVTIAWYNLILVQKLGRPLEVVMVVVVVVVIVVVVVVAAAAAE